MIPKLGLVRNPSEEFKGVTFRYLPDCSIVCDMQMVKSIKIMDIPQVEIFVNTFEVDSDE